MAARPGVGYDFSVHATADATPVEYQDCWGNDLTLIDYFLSLSPAERLGAWESFANDIADLQQHARVLSETSAADARPTSS